MDTIQLALCSQERNDPCDHRTRRSSRPDLCVCDRVGMNCDLGGNERLNHTEFRSEDREEALGLIKGSAEKAMGEGGCIRERVQI